MVSGPITTDRATGQDQAPITSGRGLGVGDIIMDRTVLDPQLMFVGPVYPCELYLLCEDNLRLL